MALPIYSVENMAAAENLLKRIGKRSTIDGKYYLTLGTFTHEKDSLWNTNAAIHEEAEALKVKK
jgi:hypothetical protein